MGLGESLDFLFRYITCRFYVHIIRTYSSRIFARIKDALPHTFPFVVIQMHQVEDGRILVNLSHHLIIYSTYRSVYNYERSKLLVAYDAFGGWRFADRFAVGSKTFVVANYHNLKFRK